MNKYDVWLNARGSGIFGPGVGPPHAFRRQTHEKFKDALCELIACYPDGKLEDFDQEAFDVIWDTFTHRRIESAWVQNADIPSGIADGTTPPLYEHKQLRIFDGGYTQYVAYLTGAGVESGFYWRWRRDRFHLFGDYLFDSEGKLCSVTLPMLKYCAGALNPQLAAKITDILGAEEKAMELATQAESRPQDVHIESGQTPAELVRPFTIDEPSVTAGSSTDAGNSASSARASPNQRGAKRVDALGAEVLQILGENPGISPGEVMGTLIRRTGKVGSCVVDHTDAHVTFRNKAGKYRDVNIKALTTRIARARTRGER